MFSILFILLQSSGASWLVWTVVVVLFLIGVAMIVYFSRRLKKSGQETEENWTLASRSLITITEPPKAIVEEQPEEQRETSGEDVVASLERFESQMPEREAVEPVIESTPQMESAPGDQESIRQTQAFASVREETSEELPVDTQMFAAVEEPPAAHTEILSSETDLPSAAPLPIEPAREIRQTEMLASPQPETTVEEAAETTPFSDEIWSELESHLQQPAPSSMPAQAAPPVRPEEPVLETPATQESAGEIDYTARVGERATNEPLMVGPIGRREPFEPPTIIPLASSEQPPAARQTQPAIRPTAMRPAAHDLPSESERPPDTRIGHAPAQSAQPTTEPASAGTKPAPRQVQGAVLGLPVDYSDQPLVLGTPVRKPEDTGVGALSNYGKQMDQEGGRWGTITMAVVVLVIAAGIAAYLYSPWFKAQFDGMLASIGRSFRSESAPAPRPEPAKAQIYPRPGQPDKNMVKARGSVINITEELLTGLAVEVNLTLNDGTTEARTVPVSPDQLAPRQQGLYEFDYDGKLYTGYSVSKLLSDGTEIRHTIPGRR